VSNMTDVNPYADKTPKRSRDWCFTIWLHDQEGNQIDQLEWELSKDDFVPLQPSIPKATYLVYQYEIGGEQQHLHIQGYVEFPNALSMLGAKKKLAKWSGENSPSMHKRRGNRYEASTYCKKEDSRCYGPFEFGDAPIEDDEPPMVKAMKMFMENGTTPDYLHQYPTYATMYTRNWNFIKTDLIAPKDWVEQKEYTRPIKVYVYWGDSGCGKTHRAEQHAPCNEVYLPCYEKGKEFSSYNGQKIVHFEEFHGQIPFETFKRMLDGKKIEVNVIYKGSKPFIPHTIIITSNHPPHRWWENQLCYQDEVAIMRRCTEIWHGRGVYLEGTAEWEQEKGQPKVEPIDALLEAVNEVIVIE